MKIILQVILTICLHDVINSNTSNELKPLGHINTDGRVFDNQHFNIHYQNYRGKRKREIHMKIPNTNDTSDVDDDFNITRNRYPYHKVRRFTSDCGDLYTCSSSYALCMCDNECHVFGDCCEDAKDFTETKMQSLNPHFTCVQTKQFSPVWLISSCPETFKDNSIRDKCSNFSVQYGDLYMMFPVYSKLYQLPFQNRYCAYCHGFMDLLPFNITLVRYHNENNNNCVVPFSSDMSDLLLSYLSNKFCDVQFSSSVARPCFSHYVRNCSSAILKQYSDKVRDFIVRECLSGSFKPVRHDSIKYWNIHCLYCSNTLNYFYDCSNSPSYSIQPLRIFLDVRTVDFTLEEQQRISSCGANRFFDRFSDTCQRVFCSRDEIYHNGKCKHPIKTIENIKISVQIHFQADSIIDEDFVHMFLRQSYEIFMRKKYSTMSFLEWNIFLHYGISLFNTRKNCTVILTSAQIVVFDGIQYPSLDFYWNFSESFHLGEHLDSVSIRQIRGQECSLCTLIAPLSSCMTSDDKIIISKENFSLNIKHKVTTSLKCPHLQLSENEMKALLNDGRSNLKEASFLQSSNSSLYAVCLEDYISSFTSVNHFMQIESVMTYVCFGLSVLSLLIFLMLIAYKLKKTLPTQTIANLALSIVLAQTTYITGIGFTEFPKFCYVSGVLLHYFWLCTFTWSVVCAFHMFRVFRRLQIGANVYTWRSLLLYIVLGYGPPFLYISVFVLASKCSCLWLNIQYGGDICFLSTYTALLYGLVYPVVIFLSVNIILFIFIVINIKRLSNKEIHKSGTERKNFVIFVKITSLMGFTWIFGLLGRITGNQIFWFVFTSLNGLQGCFLFLAFGVKSLCKQKKQKQRSTDIVKAFDKKSAALHRYQ